MAARARDALELGVSYVHLNGSIVLDFFADFSRTFTDFDGKNTYHMLLAVGSLIIIIKIPYPLCRVL